MVPLSTGCCYDHDYDRCSGRRKLSETTAGRFRCFGGARVSEFVLGRRPVYTGGIQFSSFSFSDAAALLWVGAKP